jgi:hypothetical protein
MEATILQYICEYGYETVLIALAINILTGLLKTPIKKLSAKLTDSTAVTKYITFLPIIIGFGLSVLYTYFFVAKKIVFNGDFISLWLTSSSLSLAIYAVFEKFFPSKKKVLEDYEIKQNFALIEQLKTKLEEGQPQTVTEIAKDTVEVVNEVITQELVTENTESIEKQAENTAKKIILRGKSQ